MDVRDDTLRLRGFAMVMAVFGTWTANFVVTLVFPPLIAAVGGGDHPRHVDLTTPTPTR